MHLRRGIAQVAVVAAALPMLAVAGVSGMAGAAGTSTSRSPALLTSSGSTAPRRRSWRSSRAGWGRNRSAWCSGPVSRPVTWRGCRSW